MDALDAAGALAPALAFPSKHASRFIDWLQYGEGAIGGQSKLKACASHDGSLLEALEAGPVKGSRRIHGHWLGGLYGFAGRIRTLNISKGGFQLAPAQFLSGVLDKIERTPENTFDEIINIQVEMSVARPFMEGGGRSARIRLDLTLKKNLKAPR